MEPAPVRTLRAVAAATDECAVGDVASALGVDGSTASRLVDRAAAGYLERGASDRDGRRCVLNLTPAGRQLQRRSLDVRKELLAELTCDLTESDIDLLADLLERLGKRLSEVENRA